MVQAHKEAGYDGIIVTDHFFNGNTAIDSTIPWNERVDLFCKGYENALEEGKRLDMQVFFGWEYSYKGTEFLTYGLGKDFLIAHPAILSWSVEEYFDVVHRNGGFLTHAHPFREAFYIEEIRLFPDSVDAVEVINTSHTNPSYNEKATAYAKEHSLIMTSGSDTHHLSWLSGGGMEFESALYSIEDFITALKNGKAIKLLGE